MVFPGYLCEKNILKICVRQCSHNVLYRVGQMSVVSRSARVYLSHIQKHPLSEKNGYSGLFTATKAVEHV